MDSDPIPADAERELAALRARAYGPDADIQSDPAALARLWELEAAHLPTPPDRDDVSVGAAEEEPAAWQPTMDPDDGAAEPAADDSPESAASEDPSPSRWRHAASTRAGRATIVAGALAAVLVAGYAVGWVIGPHPDATLRSEADTPSGLALTMIDFLGARPDASTFRGYDGFRGIEPWFFEDDLGFHCFMLVSRPSSVDGANCVPPGVDLFADIMPGPRMVDENSEPLPPGSIIRFHYLEDRVEVYVYPAARTD